MALSQSYCIEEGESQLWTASITWQLQKIGLFSSSLGPHTLQVMHPNGTQ